MKEKTTIVYRKLSDLVKLDHNPRTIKKEDMEKLMASIKKFWVLEGRPFLLSNRTGELVIIGGNMRYEACKKLKIDEVPTHLIEGLSEEDEREIIIRDNVSNGEWDMEMLANEWSDEPLEEWGVEIWFTEEEEEKKEEKSVVYEINISFIKEIERDEAFDKIEALGLNLDIKKK